MPGEKCRKCYLGKMTHPAPYIYTCDNCGYSYQVDPNAGWGQPIIKIINQGEKQ